MERKQKPLEKAFDKEVNIKEVIILKYNFFKENGRLNAKGRFYIKALLVLLSLIYFVTDANLVSAACLLSLLSYVIPICVDITTLTIIKKMKLKEDNLYDLLAAIGSYTIVLFPVCAILVYIARRLMMLYPEFFSSFGEVSLIITGIGIIGIVADLIIFRSKDWGSKNVFK